MTYFGHHSYLKNLKGLMAENISIIDDNENLLTSLAFHLQDHNYNVKVFTCPQQALKFHIQEPADFYVIDIKMPKLTGVEFYKELCQKLDVENLPAVFLSAVKDLESKCLEETSIGDFINKPFTFEILHARIKKNIVAINGKYLGASFLPINSSTISLINTKDISATICSFPGIRLTPLFTTSINRANTMDSPIHIAMTALLMDISTPNKLKCIIG